MIKNKKVYLTALSLVTLAVPIVSVIACGSSDSSGTNSLYVRTRDKINERINALSQVNATRLTFNDDVFTYLPLHSFTDDELGIIYPSETIPFYEEMPVTSSFFITDTDPIAQSVTVQATVALDASSQTPTFYSNTTFFKITNFDARYDLGTLNTITPYADEDALSSIMNSTNVSANQIIQALTDTIETYVAAQMPNTAIGNNYSITNFKTASGDDIATDNLKDNARSYTAVLQANKDDKYLKNGTTLTINLPQLNAFDLSTMDPNFTSDKKDWNVSNPIDVSRKYVIDTVNKQILAKIQTTNPNVQWSDLYALYSINVIEQKLPQKFDLTIPNQKIILVLSALPYNNNVINFETININLPQFPAD